MKKKLGKKAEEAIAALLTEPTNAAAAAKVGVGEATLQRWLRNPEFTAAYRAARRAVLETAVGRLQRAADNAVAALERNLTAKSEAVQVAAARAILEHAERGLELLDFADRLDDLEERLTHGNTTAVDPKPIVRAAQRGGREDQSSPDAGLPGPDGG